MSQIIDEDIRELALSLREHWKDFEGSRFLVTGAGGFLGKYIVLLLRHLNDHILENKLSALLLDNFVTGYDQQILSDERIEFKRHDVTEPWEIEGPVDYVIHAAGIASPAYYTKFPIETMDVGSKGTRNILEMAFKKKVKSFIFTSSSEVYGDPDHVHVPTSESYNGNVPTMGPRACYDESKRFGETICSTFFHVFGLPIKIVRPFNVYGPGIRPDDYRVLPNFIEHALRREPLPVHGEGHNTRSFCYINDAVEALFRVLFSQDNGEAFNIGNPEPEISVKELAHLIARIMPYPVEVKHIEPPHAVYADTDPKRRCPDISKLMQSTGFTPKYDLRTGLMRTIQWFDSSHAEWPISRDKLRIRSRLTAKERQAWRH